MLSGPFELKVNGDKSSVKSTFTMVGIDGEHYHKMIWKDFKLSTLDGNTLTGTIDVYGKDGDAPAFVVADDAPVTVTILDDAVFLLSVSTRKQCAVTLETIQYMKRRPALKIRLMNTIVRQ